MATHRIPQQVLLPGNKNPRRNTRVCVGDETWRGNVVGYKRVEVAPIFRARSGLRMIKLIVLELNWRFVANA